MSVAMQPYRAWLLDAFDADEANEQYEAIRDRYMDTTGFYGWPEGSRNVLVVGAEIDNGSEYVWIVGEDGRLRRWDSWQVRKDLR